MRTAQRIILLFLLAPVYLFAQPKHLINKSDTLLYLPYQDGKATFSYKGKMGIIDSTGKVIVPATFSRLLPLFDANSSFPYRFYYDKKKQGILDENFNIVIPVGMYDDIEILYGGFFRVKKNGQYSFVDTHGVCFDKWFEDAKDFSFGLAPVKINGKWGYINTKGELAIPNIYAGANSFSKEQLASVKLNSRWGFVDLTGTVIIPIEYEKVSHFTNNNCAVRKNGLWGYIDRTNTLFISCQYDDAEPFYCELALVKKDGQYGYINRLNEIKIPFQFNKAYSFYENDVVASVKLNGRWTHINKKGEIDKMPWDK